MQREPYKLVQCKRELCRLGRCRLVRCRICAQRIRDTWLLPRPLHQRRIRSIVSLVGDELSATVGEDDTVGTGSHFAIATLRVTKVSIGVTINRCNHP